MSDYQLYTRPGCHLCNDALTLCKELGVRPQAVDISGDVEHLRDYGDRIPVLRCTVTGGELAWPFDRETLVGFLARRGPESGQGSG